MSAHPSDATRQAADWVVQLRSPDRPASCQQEFADWLRASPLHVREYLRAVEVWVALADPAIDAASSREQLIRSAADTGLIEFPIAAVSADSIGVPQRHGSVRWSGLAAALTLVLAVVYVGWRSLSVVDVTTGIGEQRSAVLPDRSIVELNTQSEIRIAYTNRERHVELVRGEAFFEVTKDPTRPFIVSTEFATARAVGTRFSVYRAPSGTIVTVAEGRVLVRDTQSAADSAVGPAGQAEAVEVVPGTQAEAGPGRPVQMRQVDVDRLLAWRDRRLIFDGEPLAKVVQEFNRYNSPPLEIVDPRLLDQRISGIFGANDPESLLDFLAKVDHISVSRSDPHSIRIGNPL
jgi:transmembrane sensor